MSESHYSLKSLFGYLEDPTRIIFQNGVLVRYDIYREILYYLRELEKVEENMTAKSVKPIEKEYTEEADDFERVSDGGDEDGQSVQELQRQASEWTDGSERGSRRSNRHR